MIRAIENLIKSIIRFFIRVFKELSDYASTTSRQSEPALAIAPETDPGEMTATDEPPPLAIERPLILVECISCGSVGELTAICQNCQRPVCSESFCRKEVYQEGLDISVIQCRNCALMV
jgi:hypothetical protein